MSLARRVMAAIESEHPLPADVISGLAGDIHCLATLHAATPGEALERGIHRAARRLVELATPVGDGCAWVSPVEGVALAGMAHGAAGIVQALVRAAVVTRDRSLLTTAAAGLRFERTLFDAERGQWRDARPEASSHASMVAWCHGAVGVGLSRLAILDVARGTDIDGDLRSAVAATLATAPGTNHSLCHGDLGNLELPFSVARKLDDERLTTVVQERLATLLDSIDRHGVLTGAPLGAETPGLLNGIAGTGHALLRFAAPDLVPSVLMLEPSRAEFTSGRAHVRAKQVAARARPAPSPRSLQRAFDAGCAFLRGAQRRDGGLRDFSLPPGFATTWVTAHACVVLDGVPGFDELRERAADYLLASAYEGGWGYNRLTGADADSTSQALWALRRQGRQVPRAWSDRLVSWQNADGGFPTYGRTPSFSTEGWEVSHADVTVVVAWVLGELGGYDAARARALDWLHGQLDDGVLPAYWWITKAYALWAQARTASFTDRIAEHALEELSASPSSPDRSHLIAAALRAGVPASALDPHLEALLAQQCADGSWPSAPCMRLTAPRVKESGPASVGDVYPGISGVFATLHAVAAIAGRIA
jgi:hypothetical protein